MARMIGRTYGPNDDCIRKSKCRSCFSWWPSLSRSKRGKKQLEEKQWKEDYRSAQGR